MIDTLIQWLRRGARRKTTRVGCRACGKCCELFGGHLRASPTDIERWKRLGREDLLGRINRLGWIWIDPQTGRQSELCPFLQATGPDTAGCAIHDIKPDICRSYPTLAHSRRCVRGVIFSAWGGIIEAASVGLFQTMFGTFDAIF